MSDPASPDVAADWARSGVLALTGHADRAPLVPPGDAASVAAQITGQFAAATAGHRQTVRLDGACLLAERAGFTGHQRRGRVSAGGASRLLPTSDGWAVVTCARPNDLSLLSALIGADLPADPWAAVGSWLRKHPGAELAGRAELLGLAAAPVDHGTRPATTVSGAGQAPAGLLAVDFSAMWAGPLCAHLLGLAGARVVKVETPQRLDGARRGHQGFFDLLHTGHRAVLLDPALPAGRRALAALTAAADIVIEASRPRALAGFGLDAGAAVADGTVWVSITAAGRDSGRVGFGDDVAAGAGLVADDDSGHPVFCGDALADPLAGLTAAAAVMSQVRNGTGALLDISMAGVVAGTLPGRHSVPAPAARCDGPHWSIGPAPGDIRVAPPRARTPTGRGPAPGEHTGEVLRELGIPRP
jgi:hypothetical protein